MVIKQDFFIGIEDIGKEFKLSDKALLEMFTNMASIHGNMVGQSAMDTNKTHFTWIVLNWKLEVYDRPEFLQTVSVSTWSQMCTKAYAIRDFEVKNTDGKVIAKATSKWVAMNTNTGRLDRITDEIMQPYESEPEHINFPDFKFENVDENTLNIISEKEFEIYKLMIDCNNHVHNASYIDIAMEILPDGLDRKHFDNLEITYKREIKPDEKIIVKYAQKDNKHYVIIKDFQDKIIHSTLIFND